MFAYGYMHVWYRVQMDIKPPDMGNWEVGPTNMHVGMDEAALEKEQPLARAKLIRELEELKQWSRAARDYSSETGRPDPRFAQIQLAAAKELARLYRLTETPKPPAEPEPEPTQERARIRTLILTQLDKLEARQIQP